MMVVDFVELVAAFPEKKLCHDEPDDRSILETKVVLSSSHIDEK